MDTVSTSIRIDKSLLARGKEEARFNGISFNAFVCGLLAEHLQDIEDYNDAVKISKQNNKKISREEMLNKYGG